MMKIEYTYWICVYFLLFIVQLLCIGECRIANIFYKWLLLKFQAQFIFILWNLYYCYPIWQPKGKTSTNMTDEDVVSAIDRYHSCCQQCHYIWKQSRKFIWLHKYIFTILTNAIHLFVEDQNTHKIYWWPPKLLFIFSVVDSANNCSWR